MRQSRDVPDNTDLINNADTKARNQVTQGLPPGADSMTPALLAESTCRNFFFCLQPSMLVAGRTTAWNYSTHCGRCLHLHCKRS